MNNKTQQFSEETSKKLEAKWETDSPMVTDLDEYKALPKKDRTKWGFWYVTPFALPMDWMDEENNDQGWDACNKFLRKEFPIQHRVREFVSDIGVYWRCLGRIWHEKVTCPLNPRQKWLTKQIPKTWCDKVEITHLVLFACIVHFVEEEMHIVDWEWAEGHSKAKKEIMEIYNYIKKERPKLEKEDLESFALEIEKKINDLDDEMMIRIIKVRHYLWA